MSDDLDTATNDSDWPEVYLREVDEDQEPVSVEDRILAPLRSVLADVSPTPGVHLEFLIAPRKDGWYIHAEAPASDDFLKQDPQERWSFHWIGPYPTRDEAILALPAMLVSHADSFRRLMEEIEEAAEDMSVSDLVDEARALAEHSKGPRPVSFHVVKDS